MKFWGHNTYLVVDALQLLFAAKAPSVHPSSTLLYEENGASFPLSPCQHCDLMHSSANYAAALNAESKAAPRASLSGELL
jgi:hypothetical protein